MEHFKKYYEFMAKSDELSSLIDTVVYMIIYNFPHHIYKGSQETLAKWCKTSSRNVRRSLQRLEKLGLISSEFHGGNWGKCKIYKVMRKPEVNQELDSDIVENDYWLVD